MNKNNVNTDLFTTGKTDVKSTEAIKQLSQRIELISDLLNVVVDKDNLEEYKTSTRQANELKKLLTEEKKKSINPLKEKIELVNKSFLPLENILFKAIGEGKQNLLNYQLELNRIIEEERQKELARLREIEIKKQEEIDRLNREREKLKNEEASKEEISKLEEEQNVVNEESIDNLVEDILDVKEEVKVKTPPPQAIQTRTKKTIVVDEKTVLRRYMMPNMDLIKQDLKKGIKITGVTIKEETIAVLR